MDVLIKNMEMPKEPTYLVIYPEGKWQETTSSAEGKAIELPPHGRLGDLEDLEDKALAKFEHGYDKAEDILAEITLAPTVLEAST